MAKAADVLSPRLHQPKDSGREAGVLLLVWLTRFETVRFHGRLDTLQGSRCRPRTIAVQSVNHLSRSEAAYIAGIIDGEGTVTLTRTHRGENRRPIVSISSTELTLLLYVRRVVGAGRITNKARARAHHSPSFAYCVSSRQALALLRQVSRYLHTYKSQRAQILLREYVRVTPRNGRYSEQQRADRQAFEARFFSFSIRGKAG